MVRSTKNMNHLVLTDNTWIMIRSTKTMTSYKVLTQTTMVVTAVAAIYSLKHTF